MTMTWQPIETAPKDGTKFLMYITGFRYQKNNANDKYKRKEIKKTQCPLYRQKAYNFKIGGGE